jgi:SpoVK/Ycf46/Vps4 family AAA+-type ATPase
MDVDNICQSVPTMLYEPSLQSIHQYLENEVSSSLPHSFLYEEDNNEYKHTPSFKISDNSNKRPNLNRKNNQSYGQPPIIFSDDLFKQIFYSTDDDLDKNRSNKIKTPICNNPYCDHKDFTEDETPVTTQQMNVNNIDDLITLGKTYHCKKNKEYNGVSLRILCDLVGPLNELKDMIGMKTVKECIFNQIVFFLQGLNKRPSCGKCNECNFKLPCLKGQEDMLHTVITGSPGCGKTELGKIMGKLYKAMGILESDTFKLVTRSDLIGKYLGHTAAKTQQVIDSCKGGVMFIDEAYSLGSGNVDYKDSFSKECLDTLNQNLSERRDFLCIIAGYKDELEKCFFAMNPGLRRRFTFRYDIEKYTPEELLQIFLLKLQKEGWSMECKTDEMDTNEMKELKEKQENELIKLFKSNYKEMPHFGGDVETLFLNCKIIHGNRVLFLNPNLRKVLSVEDVRKGFEKYVSFRKNKDMHQEYDDVAFYSNNPK